MHHAAIHRPVELQREVVRLRRGADAHALAGIGRAEFRFRPLRFRNMAMRVETDGRVEDLPAELFAIGRYVRSTARQTETKRRLRVHDPHRSSVYPSGHNKRIVNIWEELSARGLRPLGSYHDVRWLMRAQQSNVRHSARITSVNRLAYASVIDCWENSEAAAGRYRQDAQPVPDPRRTA